MYSSLSEVQNDLNAGAISCKELVQSYLKRITEKKNLNIFLEVFEKSALAKAEEVDKKLKEKKAGKLAGMIVAIKDNICYKDHKVSASSKILEGFVSLYSATVVERLLSEDAILIGRTNCDEFAMGSSNENSAYDNVLNPLDTSRVPGGHPVEVQQPLQLIYAGLHSEATRVVRFASLHLSSVWWE